MFRFRLLSVFTALTLALAGLSGLAFAQGTPISRYILPGERVFPEGVAFQPSTNSFYVSSTTDGTIFRGTLDQENATVFLQGGGDGRTTAVGLKVDERGRLFVAGGGTGQMFVYDTADGKLLGKFAHGKTPTFVNDVAVTPDGTAYFTDSMDPTLYRVTTGADGQLAMDAWLPFAGTPLTYQQGFNLNGIAAGPDGKYLVVVQSNVGKLFRIEVATRTVAEIPVAGGPLNAGDGILLDGSTLYVARNAAGLIVSVQMSADLSSGTVVGSTTSPLLAYPTTIAKAGDRLLVVNSQFDKRGENLTPVLPFTLASIPLPAAQATPGATVVATQVASPVAATATPEVTTFATATAVAAPGMPSTGGGGWDGFAGALLGILAAAMLMLVAGGYLALKRR